MANMKLLTFVVLPLLAAADNGGPPSQAVINCVKKKESDVFAEYQQMACGYGSNTISCTHECIQKRNETLGDMQAQLDGSCCELATEWTPDYCRKKIAEISDQFQQFKETCSTTTTTSPGVHAPPKYCVSWHVGQNAEGEVFSDRTAAETKFNQLSGGSWAEVLENGQLRVLKRYGSMGESDWQMLDDWCGKHLSSPSKTPTTSPGVHAPPTYCVSWHVRQHAEGEVFSDRTAAETKFNQLSGGSWAEVLENGQLRVLKRYGSMGESDWQMLDDWCGKNLSSPETHAYDFANMFSPQFLPKLALAGMACVGGVVGAVTVIAFAGIRKHKLRGEPLLSHV